MEDEKEGGLENAVIKLKIDATFRNRCETTIFSVHAEFSICNLRGSSYIENA